MTMSINTVQAAELVSDVIRAGLVPMLSGSPGLGKSSVLHAIADEFNLEVIDVRLSQCDPTDLLGFPTIDKESGKSRYAPMEMFPLADDALPAGKDGWLLFLDEFNSAPMSVQAAAYKLVLDRMHGMHKLHPHVAIVCAGNKQTDQAIVNRMSTAMQSRLVHLELEIDHKAWDEWATKNGIDFRITSFIKFKPDSLFRFNPDHDDVTFACPRTWEFASKIVKQFPNEIPASKLALLAGTISEGMAVEFTAFCKIVDKLPSIDQIVSNPKKTPVPSDEPGTLFALSGAIGNAGNEKNLEALMTYVERMPLEFQVISMQDMLKRNRSLLQEPSIRKWIQENTKMLF